MKEILEKQGSTLQRVEKLMQMDRLIQLSQAALQLKTDKDLNKDEQLNLNKLDSITKLLKDMNVTLSKSEKHLSKQLSDKLSEKASKLKRVTSVSDIIKEKQSGIKDFFTLRGFLDKTGIAERGGKSTLSRLADAREEENKYVQDKLEVNKNTYVPGTKAEKSIVKNARKEFRGSQKLLKAKDETDAKIERLKAAGFSDKDIKRSGLVKRQEQILTGLTQVDSRFKSAAKDEESTASKETARRVSAKIPETPTSNENEIEAQRLRERQVDLLEKIEKNTEGLKPASGKEKEGNSSGESGGGLLGAFGGVLGGLGTALAKLGRGVGRGLQGLLFGLARGFAALANPATIIGMGAFSIAALGIGKALQMAAPAIQAFAPIVETVADVIKTVFVEGIKALPEIITSIGDTIVKIISTISNSITGVIDTIVTSIERLGKIDGSNLLSVGAGLVAIGGGLAAFAAGNVVAGLTNFVGGLLSAVTGQKTPLEQLEAIAKLGPGLQQAGDGLQKVSAGLSSFNKPEANSGNAITGMTNKMKDAKDAASQQQQRAPVIVSAPTTVTSNKQNIAMPQPIRNTDSGFTKYLRDKMSFV